MTKRFLSLGRKFPLFERDLESESLSGYWNQSPDKRTHPAAGSWSWLKGKGINNAFNKEHTLYFSFRGSPFHCGTTGGNANACWFSWVKQAFRLYEGKWDVWQLDHMIQNGHPVCGMWYKMATRSVRTQPRDTKWLPGLEELSHAIQNGHPVCENSTTWYKMAAQSVRAQPCDQNGCPASGSSATRYRMVTRLWYHCTDLLLIPAFPFQWLSGVFLSLQALCASFTLSQAVWHKGPWAAS